MAASRPLTESSPKLQERSRKESKEHSCCITCGVKTNYVCIQCSTSVCNRCSKFENNESCEGWEAGRSVGYCFNCSIFTSDNNEEEINVPVDSHATTKNSSFPGGTVSCSEDSDEYTPHEQSHSKSKKKDKKGKPGRKAMWSTATLDDLVDIITCDERYQRKLIFTNSKNQNNSIIYGEVLKKLTVRANERGEKILFNIQQVRTKFKRCVSDCKKAAMTIKTATGIKRFQNEKGYGKWFDLLFPLVKTRDSCQPEMAVEPSALGDISEEEEVARTFEDFVPTKKLKLPKKNKMAEAIDLLKQVVEKDPAKELVSFMKDEAEKARKHELQLVELMLKHNNHTSNQVSFSPPQDKSAEHPRATQDMPQNTWTGVPQYFNFQGVESPMYMSTTNHQQSSLPHPNAHGNSLISPSWQGSYQK